MVATAEEDSRLFWHHQQREPEYARGKPYHPYPVVVLTLMHDLPMFVSQLMINLWNTEGIRFCFFSYETLQMIMNIRINVYTFATIIVVLSETWFMQPDSARAFCKPQYSQFEFFSLLALIVTKWIWLMVVFNCHYMRQYAYQLPKHSRITKWTRLALFWRSCGVHLHVTCYVRW